MIYARASSDENRVSGEGGNENICSNFIHVWNYVTKAHFRRHTKKASTVNTNKLQRRA